MILIIYSSIIFLGWIQLRDRLAQDFNVTLQSRTIGIRLSLEEAIQELLPAVKLQLPEFTPLPEFLHTDFILDTIMSSRKTSVAKSDKSNFSTSISKMLTGPSKTSDKVSAVPPSPSAGNGSLVDSLLDDSTEDTLDSSALQVVLILIITRIM